MAKTKTISVEFKVIETGQFGNYIDGPIVQRYLKQAATVAALAEAYAGLSNQTIPRSTGSKLVLDALDSALPEHRAQTPPPSLSARLGFGTWGVLRRIGQDLSGTGAIAEAIVLLGGIVRELQLGLSSYLNGAERAPDQHTARANELATAAEEISRQHRARKGVF